MSSKQSSKFSILLVCAGNICRSPTAEGVLRKRLTEAGLADRVSVDSAGTHGFHAGEAPDLRAQEVARGHGYDISDLRARRVTAQDIERFDLILGMDKENMSHLQALASADQKEKIKLLLAFSPTYPNQEVPDPYYGGRDGFERVIEMIEDGVAGVVRFVKSTIEKGGGR